MCRCGLSPSTHIASPLWPCSSSYHSTLGALKPLSNLSHFTPLLPPSSHHPSPLSLCAQMLWDEYTLGLNGGPALMELEERYGVAWRAFDRGMSLWSERMVFISDILAAPSIPSRIAALDAGLNALKAQLPEGTRRGRRCKPVTWPALLRELRAQRVRKLPSTDSYSHSCIIPSVSIND